jgi:hypothetical protein
LTNLGQRDEPLFAQASQGFIDEVRTYPLVHAGRSAHIWVVVAQTEVKFICGIVAGASAVGFAVVIGTEIAEFMMENRDNFRKWHDQFSAVLKARAFLKHRAPVLYDRVFDAVLHQLYRDVKGHIPDSVTPEIVSFGLGVVIGSVGKKIAQGKFSYFALIFAILEQLTVRFTLSFVPGAIKITEDEYRKLADQIIARLRTAGVIIQDADVRKIIEEVRQHPAEIKQAFDMMRDAFEQNSAAR